VKPVETRDRAELERFMRRDGASAVQVYGLADLDEPFWPALRAFATRDASGELAAACLVLGSFEPPIVYAVAPPRHAPTLDLLGALAPDLPDAFFANLPLGALPLLAREFEVEPHGEHVKMELVEPDALERVDVTGVEPLGPAHADELGDFYAGAYLPDERGGRFFARSMLALGPYFGVREAGQLVSVAGLHVLSERYGVAAIGNVATRPDRRGRGLARAVTARLARALRERVATIGLNVHAGNAAARRCYESLGFRERLRYDEGVLRRRRAR
jgi:ribosomal protein S18 acetylase RimI-like enzyme